MTPGDTLTVVMSRCFPFTPQLDGRYRLATGKLNNSETTDPTVSVYKPDGSRYAYDDDSGGNLQSHIAALPMAAGSNYSVCVRAYSSSYLGKSVNFTLSVYRQDVFAPVAAQPPPASSDGSELYGLYGAYGDFGAYGSAGAVTNSALLTLKVQQPVIGTADQ